MLLAQLATCHHEKLMTIEFEMLMTIEQLIKISKQNYLVIAHKNEHCFSKGVMLTFQEKGHGNRTQIQIQNV